MGHAHGWHGGDFEGGAGAVGAEEVGWGWVGFPPEYFDAGDGCVCALDQVWDCELCGDNAALVVYAHEDAEDSVEDYPCDPEVSPPFD